jgi:hypothetical protein
VEVTLQSKLPASDKVMSLSQRAAIAGTAVLLLTIVRHSHALCASPPLSDPGKIEIGLKMKIGFGISPD